MGCRCNVALQKGNRETFRSLEPRACWRVSRKQCAKVEEGQRLPWKFCMRQKLSRSCSQVLIVTLYNFAETPLKVSKRLCVVVARCLLVITVGLVVRHMLDVMSTSKSGFRPGVKQLYRARTLSSTDRVDISRVYHTHYSAYMKEPPFCSTLWFKNRRTVLGMELIRGWKRSLIHISQLRLTLIQYSQSGIFSLS